MELEPNDLLLFARVVDAGNLTRAAGRLGVPKSTVSRRIAALEAQLGERLLLRTTRKMSITDLGLAVLEHARRVGEDVQAASALAQHRQSAPSGRLRVTMAGDLANLLLAPLMAEFLARHPLVTLEVDLSSRIVDLVGENFDLALRMGELRDDANLAARRIAVFASGLYAAPAYLERHGQPANPQALMKHRVLHARSQGGDPFPWRLFSGGRRWEGVPPTAAMINSPGSLMQLALNGAGITMAHDDFAAPHVRSAALVRVLPKWHFAPAPMWAVFPGRRLMPARTRAFIDALLERLGTPECHAAEALLDRMNRAATAGLPARGGARPRRAAGKGTRRA
jgi:DNA-binding transcriptional LysR family regulator